MDVIDKTIKLLQAIKDTCLEYCKAELLTNDKAIGRAEVADKILQLIINESEE